MSPVIVRQHPNGSTLYAAFNSEVRFIEPGVRESRFAARLAPYPSREDAEAALGAACAHARGEVT